MLVAGFAWPVLFGRPSEAARNEATEFLDASQAMESAAAARTAAERDAQMSEVRDRYREARKKVESTRDAAGKTAFWLKVAGGGVAAVGAFGLLANRS
ncbi:hypothetical protein Pla111_13880 [Botrimarina hoheduenensis]|uniref:Uncharacterized protein n=1 Tax=Botrimarina hoheduenensis TaxID=2528000 RepID=A0A5C5WB75_9BACT|nr:hypothetical protein Pla111_13880 [Botrimarina hoheduenensis]